MEGTLWKRIMKITLANWAKKRFDPPPHPNTLLNWTRDGKIIPCPVKFGRAYFVEENARHLAEILNGPSTQIT